MFRRLSQRPLLRRLMLLAPMAVIAALVLSACAAFGQIGGDINRALNGVPATMSTYTQFGDKIDQVHGVSIQVSRDDRFDSVNEKGGSNADSSVLLISVGQNSHVSHVGSTMVIAQEGLTSISDSVSPKVSVTNNQPGTPWLNNIFEKNRNLWKGKSKTIMIRSQSGLPVAVYAGNAVEAFATDVPKSTAFRVDGLYLFVYRADYTVFDNDLLL